MAIRSSDYWPLVADVELYFSASVAGGIRISLHLPGGYGRRQRHAGVDYWGHAIG